MTWIMIKQEEKRIPPFLRGSEKRWAIWGYFLRVQSAMRNQRRWNSPPGTGSDGSLFAMGSAKTAVGRKISRWRGVYLSAMKRVTWGKLIALLILLLQAVAIFVPAITHRVEPPTSFASYELRRWIDDVVKFWVGLFKPGEKESPGSPQRVAI